MSQPRKNRKRRRQAMTPIKQYSFLSIRDRREYLEMNLTIRRRKRATVFAMITALIGFGVFFALHTPWWAYAALGLATFIQIWYLGSTLEDLILNRTLYQSRLGLPSQHARTFQRLSLIEERSLLNRDIQRLDERNANAQQPLL